MLHTQTQQKKGLTVKESKEFSTLSKKIFGDSSFSIIDKRASECKVQSRYEVLIQKHMKAMRKEVN